MSLVGLNDSGKVVEAENNMKTTCYFPPHPRKSAGKVLEAAHHMKTTDLVPPCPRMDWRLNIISKLRYMSLQYWKGMWKAMKDMETTVSFPPHSPEIYMNKEMK